MLYDQTLSRVETYFDKTASKTWEQLTSDAPVSKIRQTVRIGRERMRNKLLDQLPNDLSEARILDAGCGTGQLTTELVKRGASVVATDISNSLIQIAKNRILKKNINRFDEKKLKKIDKSVYKVSSELFSKKENLFEIPYKQIELDLLMEPKKLKKKYIESEFKFRKIYFVT